MFSRSTAKLSDTTLDEALSAFWGGITMEDRLKVVVVLSMVGAYRVISDAFHFWKGPEDLSLTGGQGCTTRPDTCTQILVLASPHAQASGDSVCQVPQHLGHPGRV